MTRQHYGLLSVLCVSLVVMDWAAMTNKSYWIVAVAATCATQVIYTLLWKMRDRKRQ